MTGYGLGAQRWRRFFPFLNWFPIAQGDLRGDLLAGLTGALVLVPKAMAYAYLAGLPVQYGLYVAFIPAILGARWGSSAQLATGPVAVISLMTAAALTPLAVPQTEAYVALALLLAFLVGVTQFALGALKLGTVVSFVSHPVILGFMNAAAVLIALSQIDLMLGIPKGRGDVFLVDIWEMLGHLPQTHWPTLAMSLLALALMLGLRRVARLSKLSVLIAVAVTIIVSAVLDFDRNASAVPADIADPNTREQVLAYAQTSKRLQELAAAAPARNVALRALEASDARAAAQLRHQLHLEQIDAAVLKAENKERLSFITKLEFQRSLPQGDEAARFFVAGQAAVGVELNGERWRIRKIDNGRLSLNGGGDVVGQVPRGLPSLAVPTLAFDAVASLLSAALVIALVAFMESIAMAKAIAAKTRQSIDPNQELMGQGLANIGGAFFQSYPAAGSFTGSAINLQAGAKTGMAMVFNGLFVVLTLLLLTPLLYHLPKATLGVIIVLAVVGLMTPAAFRHAWQASRSDGVVAITTFCVTLLAAPHLDRGILFGTLLAIALYLYRTVKPRVALLGRHPDGALRDLKVYPELPTSRRVIALRFDDSLYFANAAIFEQAVLDAVASKPDARYLLIVGSGINQMDASGEDVVRHLVERLAASGVTLVFAGLKKQVLDLMARTGLYAKIGADRFFANEDRALAAIDDWLGDDADGGLRVQPATPGPGLTP